MDTGVNGPMMKNGELELLIETRGNGSVTEAKVNGSGMDTGECESLMNTIGNISVMERGGDGLVR